VTDQFVVALVGAPFGLKGFVKVQSLSRETDHLKRLRSVVLRREKAEGLYEVEETSGASRFFLMKFKGIDTPEAAKGLQGAELVTDRAHAAPLKAGEFYIEDLRGLEVVSVSGVALGRVRDVIEGGGGELAEVRLPGGELRLVPFRQEFLGDINLKTGKAVLLKEWILE
jgi:16S rRNA processing protein RimM